MIINRPTATILFLLTLLAATLPRCEAAPKREQRKRKRGVKIVIRWPGYTPATVDETIGFESRVQFVRLGSVARMTSISTFDRADIYVEAHEKTTRAAFSRAVIQQLALMVAKLPADAYVSQWTFLEDFTSPPEVKIRTVKHLHIALDRVALSRHGIRSRAVFAKIKSQQIDLNERPPKQKTLKALRRLSIRSPDGTTLRLGELAEIKAVKGPSHRVGRWPPAKPNK